MIARQMKENERSAPLSNDVEPQLIDDQWTLDAIEMEIAESQGIAGTNVSPGARAGINVAQEKLKPPRRRQDEYYADCFLPHGKHYRGKPTLIAACTWQ